MATIPPVTAPQNSTDKASPSDWTLEVQTSGPDGKATQQKLQLASGHAHTLVVESGVQFKLSPSLKPVKDPNTQIAPAGPVSHAKKGLDLQLMLPGGGSLVLMGFYAVHPKAAPTKLQVTQLDGKEESVFSSLPKDAPATAGASVQEGESKPSASAASSAVEPLPVDQASLKAVKDGGKSKSKGKKTPGDDDSSWFSGFDGSWLGLLALAGLGGGGGGGGSSAGNNAGNNAGNGASAASIVSGTFTGGPAVVGNGLAVEVYDVAGKLLGSSKLSDQGVYKVDIGTYRGVVVVKTVDTNAGVDFMDEATGVSKDLNAVYMAVAVIDGSKTQVAVNINALTTVAAMRVGLNPADGSGDVSGTTSSEKIASVLAANLAVAKIIRMTEVLTEANVTATVNADGSLNSSANTMGKMLAAFSGADKSHSGDMVMALNTISSAMAGQESAASTVSSVQNFFLVGAANASLDLKEIALILDPTSSVTAANFSSSASQAVSALSPAVVVQLKPEQLNSLNADQIASLDASGQLSSLTSVQRGQLLNDKTPPVAPSMRLAADTGLLNNDAVTQAATVNVNGIEAGATWQYRIDGGAWVNGVGNTFQLIERSHTYEVRQTDALGNVSALKNTSFNLDTTAPTLTISDSEAGTAKGPVLFTLSFSETVSDFDLSKLSVTGGTASNFKQVGATQYTVVVTPAANSTADIVLSVAAGSVRDLAGNALASAVSATQAVNTVFDANTNPAPTPDTTAPTLTISDSEAGTAKGPVLFTLSFSETVSDFDLSKLSVTGGTASNFKQVGANQYTVVVTPTANSTTPIVVSVAAGSVRDLAGNALASAVSATQSVDTISPEAPTLGLGTGVSNGATSAEATAAGGVVTVNAETNASTVVTLTRGSNTVSKTVTGTGAAQAVTLTSADLTTLGNGTISVSAVATDGAGNASTAATTSFTLDTVAPVLSINAVASNDIVNATKKAAGVTVSGTSDAQAGQIVTIIWGNTTQTSQLDSNGRWQTLFNAVDVPADASSSTITARVSDQAGNPATDATRTVRIDTTPPTISITTPLTDGAGLSGDADAIFNKNELDAVSINGNFTLTGTTTAEVGQTVNVVLNTKSYSSVVAVGNTWTVLVPTADMSALVHGNSYSVSVSVSDSADNAATPASNTLEVKLAPPDVPTITIRNTNDTTPVISGTAKKENPSAVNTYIALEAADTLVVTVNGQSYSLTVGGNSSPTGLSYNTSTSVWSLDVTGTQTLAQGVYDVGVSVNAVGYVTAKTDISTGELVIKTVAPVLTVNAIAVDDVINIRESANALTLSGTATDNRPGTTTNTAVGQTLSLSLGGTTYNNIVVQNDGTWSVVVPAANVALLTGSSYNAQVSYAGIYGNTGTQSRTLAVDVAAPATPNAALTQDTGTADATPVTRNGAITALTNTEAQATLEYRVTKDGGTPSSWSTTYTAPVTNGTADGAYKVDVRQTDQASNPSPVQSVNFVLDTQNPNAPSLALGTGVSNGATSAEATAAGGVVTVNAETNASTVVTFTRGSNTVSKTVNGTGAAQAVTLTSADLTTLGDGTISVSAVATDGAGNASTAATTSFTLDVTPPTLSSGTAPSTALSPAIAGTAGNSADETIVLTVTFDGSVNGLTSGTDSTIFKVAGTGVSATWDGSGTSRTLTYTVQAGHNGQATIDEAALKTALIAGISDAAGNAFSYTANSGNIANIDATALPVVDTTAPVVTAPATFAMQEDVLGNLVFSNSAFSDASSSLTVTL